MKKLTKAALIALAAAAAASAEGRTLTEQHIDSVVSSTNVIALGRSDSATGADDQAIRERILTFYYDQFRHSQDPDAPYFLFMSKDGNMLMGIGGTLRMRAYYDWGGAMPSPAFMPIQIPIPADPLNSKHLGTTPAGTCLFFRMVGRGRHIGEYQVYIEANFNGYSARDFHLKKAYGMIGDFTVGYASSTFSDPAAVPPTVDAGGPNNKMDHTTVLVRYMPRLTRSLLAAVSIENPDTEIGADGTATRARSSYMPDFSAMLQYSWAPLQHVRASAIVRSLPYRNMEAGLNHSPVGWGVQLSSVSNPCDAVTVYLTANYGAGYAGMGGDLLAGAYDLIADHDTPGRLYAPRSFGWNAGVQYNLRHNLFASVSVAQTRFLPSRAVSPDEYKYGLLATVNAFWNPLPRFQVGAEFDFARRQNFSGAHRYARRLGLMAQITF